MRKKHSIKYKNHRDLGIFELSVGTISFMVSFLVIYEMFVRKDYVLILMFIFMFGYGILAIMGGYKNIKEMNKKW